MCSLLMKTMSKDTSNSTSTSLSLLPLTDDNNRTPLHHAAQNGHKGVISLFLTPPYTPYTITADQRKELLEVATKDNKQAVLDAYLEWRKKKEGETEATEDEVEVMLKSVF